MPKSEYNRAPSLSLFSESNPKLMKGLKQIYYPISLMMSPGRRSGHDVCPFASPGCLAACLNTAGHGSEYIPWSVHVHAARLRRTHLYFNDRAGFFDMMRREIEKHRNFAATHKFEFKERGRAYFTPSRKGMIFCIRLNCTSDIPYERIQVPGTKKTIMELYPEIQFYDYTKIPGRIHRPENYHLTYSHHENFRDSAGRLHDSDKVMREYMEYGVNTAVVFGTKHPGAIPARWRGVPVLNGTTHDLRFLDPPGHIVGLTALGQAIRDATGFVIPVAVQINFPYTEESEATDNLFPGMMPEGE